MSDQPKPFSIDIGTLRTRRKDMSTEAQGRADAAAGNMVFSLGNRSVGGTDSQARALAKFMPRSCRTWQMR